MLRVFVVGCSRGGTTLTQRLLAERLGLLTLPETRFFVSLIGNTEQHMFPNTSRKRSLLKGLSSNLRERLGLSTGMEWDDAQMIPGLRHRKWRPIARPAAEFTAGMDRLAREAECRGWLEKTPMHVHYAPEIMHHVDGAWMVHVIRNAQDNIASICDAARKYADPWAIIYDCVERAVDNWNASIADSARMVGRERQIFVPYAALSLAPEAVLRLILEKMNTFAADPGAQGTSAQMTSTRDQVWKGEAVGGAVAPAASKWDTALSVEEQATARAMIAPIPAELQHAMQPFYVAAQKHAL